MNMDPIIPPCRDDVGGRAVDYTSSQSSPIKRKSVGIMPLQQGAICILVGWACFLGMHGPLALNYAASAPPLWYSSPL